MTSTMTYSLFLLICIQYILISLSQSNTASTSNGSTAIQNTITANTFTRQEINCNYGISDGTDFYETYPLDQICYDLGQNVSRKAQCMGVNTNEYVIQDWYFNAKCSEEADYATTPMDRSDITTYCKDLANPKLQYGDDESPMIF